MTTTKLEEALDRLRRAAYREAVASRNHLTVAESRAAAAGDAARAEVLAVVEGLAGALRGSVTSLELALEYFGADTIAGGVLRGFFQGEPERAEAALALVPREESGT